MPPFPHLDDVVWQARWVLPNSDTLLSPGCLEVRGGRIARVWEGGDDDAIQLGNVAIVPGLINAHTHLEFSDLPRPLGLAADAAEVATLSPPRFATWIREVIISRQRRPADFDVRSAIRRGWEECAAAGTVAVGEIATADESAPELHECHARGVVFREVLGLRDETVAAGLDTARRFLAAAVPATAMLQRGLSPHAPYSVHPELFRGLLDLAVTSGAPVAMHLAESRAELELLAHHRGELVDLLTDLGLWRAERFADFRQPLDYLRELSRVRQALVVHGNYLAEDELNYLATQPHLSVAYCPRTHAQFGHAPHPWLKLQERGIRVVLGTDSRASNPDLSLLNELRWLQHRHPDVSARTLLRMATTEAAAALGLSPELGELTPGRSAAFTTVRPGAPLTATDWSGLWRACA